MSKSNWQKSMRNVNLSDNRSQRYKKQRYSCEIVISETDQNRLKIFQSNELKYFNSLVELLQNKARVYPNSLISLTPDQIKLFGMLAYSSESIKELKSGKTPNNEKLLFLKEYWTNRNAKSYIPEHMELLFESAGSKVVLDPNTREAMATELLTFFIEQAHAFSSAVNSEKMEIAFKVAPQIITQAELTQKRHNQLPKKSVTWIWDAKTECSLVKTPYTYHALEIPGINLNEDVEWDLMIIHQQPGIIPVWNTPWLVEFQKSNSKYLIKYLDLVNPKAGSAFGAAMRGR